MNLKQYIIHTDSEKEIYIPSSEWTELNSFYNKDDIKLALSDLISDENVPLPMRKLTQADADASFEELLSYKQIYTRDEWFSRYDYKYPLTNLVFKMSTVGNKSSDFYHQTNRYKCDSINAPSPHRTWYEEKFRLTLLPALWSMKMKEVSSSTLRSIISLRKYTASQFRPSTAKAVYHFFDAEHVLDLSMGWGDRLAGFMASDGKSYTGIDPNTALHTGYNAQIARYGRNKTYKFIDGCAEDSLSQINNRKYNLIFTSPPYFNIERYSSDDKQSYKKYRKLNNWLDGFLFKSLSNAWEVLDSGGHLVINISDVYSNHTINKICDPMNDFISLFNDAEYVGCFCYEMAKRPNSGALSGKTGTFGEPMWVWKKK